MTRYRKVIRNTKGGNIVQHADIDWIYYCKVHVNYEWHSCTTRTLEQGEKWIAEKKTMLSAPRRKSNVQSI
jgi:hypothetical protein